jgi:hypothetical protein
VSTRVVLAHAIENAIHGESAYQRTADRLAGAARALPMRIQNPGTFLGVALERVAWCLILARPESELWDAVRDALDLGRALFRAAMAERHTRVQAEFRGTAVEIQGGPHEYVDGQNWLWTWALARVLRHRAALRELCAFEASRFDSGRSPAFFVLLIETVQAMEAGRPWEALHDRAMSATSGPRATLALPWLGALDALDQTGRPGPDADALNRELERALLAHRDVYASPDNAHRTQSRVDWVSVGLANRALDEGLALTCASDYIPITLARGARAPTWEQLLAEPVPELALEHNLGHPDAPDAIDGNHRLFMWMDGRVRLEHRSGRRARGWTARVAPSIFQEVLALARASDLLHHGEPTLPGGPSFRIVSLHHAGRHADALVARTREAVGPWRDLFTWLDSVVVAVSGQRPAGSLGTRTVVVHERTAYAP